MRTTRRPTYGANYFERLPNGPGLHRLRYNSCMLVDFALLVLRAGETYTFSTAEKEYGIDLLRGEAAIAAGPEEWVLVDRGSVFDSLPRGAYIGCGEIVRISARTEVQIALGSAPSSTPIPSYPIHPTAVVTGHWGADATRRDFRYLINADRPSERLWLAEVIVTHGRWATYPPHKHEDVPEDIFQEEIYYYRVDPAHGFGFCGQFEGLVGTDYAFLIRDNTVHKMPHGYHTVVSAPGYRVWYLAIYAGRDKRHKPSPHPDHVNFTAQVPSAGTK